MAQPVRAVEKLNHLNFPTWQGPMFSTMVINKCVAAIKEQPTGPMSEAAIVAAAELDELARAYLQLNIEPQMWKTVRHLKTAREIWVFLEQLHAQKSLLALTRVSRELNNLQQVPGELVDVYFTRASDLRTAMADAGSEISDAQMVVFLLEGLCVER